MKNINDNINDIISNFYFDKFSYKDDVAIYKTKDKLSLTLEGYENNEANILFEEIKDFIRLNNNYETSNIDPLELVIFNDNDQEEYYISFIVKDNNLLIQLG